MAKIDIEQVIYERLSVALSRARALFDKIARTGGDKVVIAVVTLIFTCIVAVVVAGWDAVVCVLVAYGAGSLRSSNEKTHFTDRTVLIDREQGEQIIEMMRGKSAADAGDEFEEACQP